MNSSDNDSPWEPDSTFIVEAPISSDVGLEDKECPLPRESD